MLLFVSLFLLCTLASCAVRVDDPLNPQYWSKQDFLQFAQDERKLLKGYHESVKHFGEISTSAVVYSKTLYDRQGGIVVVNPRTRRMALSKLEVTSCFMALTRQSFAEYATYVQQAKPHVLIRKSALMALLFAKFFHNMLDRTFGMLWKGNHKILLDQYKERLTLTFRNQTRENLETFLDTAIATTEEILPICHQQIPACYGVLKETLKIQISLLATCWKTMDLSGSKVVLQERFTPEYITEAYFISFQDYMLTKWKKKEISSDTIANYLTIDYFDQLIQFLNDDSTIPADQFFRNYLLQSQDLKTYMVKKREVLQQDSERRYTKVVKELDDMLLLETETVSGSTKKPKRKNKGRQPETKIEPVVNDPVASPPVKLVSGCATVKRQPIDVRDKIYTTLLVGQYLRTKFLEKALACMGFVNYETWSWDEVKAALTSEIKGIPLKRKQFLLNCIEWNRLRNEVAHPAELYSAAQSEMDLIQAPLGVVHYKSLLSLFKRRGLLSAETASVRISGTDRPVGFVSIGETQKTVSAIRVYEVILQKILLPFCKENEISRVSLSLLENWKRDMSHFNAELDVTEEEMASIFELAKLRNKLAHPIGSLRQIKDYLNAVFMEDDTFGPNIVSSKQF